MVAIQTAGGAREQASVAQALDALLGALDAGALHYATAERLEACALSSDPRLAAIDTVEHLVALGADEARRSWALERCAGCAERFRPGDSGPLCVECHDAAWCGR